MTEMNTDYTVAGLQQHVRDRASQALKELGVEQPVELMRPPDPKMGDLGFPCFAYARLLRKAPTLIAQDVAARLKPDGVIQEVVVDKAYVNIRLRARTLFQVVLGQVLRDRERFGADQADGSEHWMVEYSAPNTNKPLHLGHLRNNLLGSSVARILGFYGHQVTRINLVNDRGVHICKSMLAYQQWGEGTDPGRAGMKGDHLVGDFYVLFDRRFTAEYEAWQHSASARAKLQQWLQTGPGEAAAQAHQKDPETTLPEKEPCRNKMRPREGRGARLARSEEGAYPSVCNRRTTQPGGMDRLSERAGYSEAATKFFGGYRDRYFNEESVLGRQVRRMLRQWEEGDAEVMELWERLNSWVLEGFDQSYARMGVAFDHVQRESQTYKLGKALVEQGVERGVFTRLTDGAVVCDLTQVKKKGEKVLLRSDGTSVYMTQDLGTAMERFDRFALDRLIYVVGDEQRYHFDVLFSILGLLRPGLDQACTHLAYGMIRLPEGKMKSREGTVVDADDLMDEVHRLAREETLARAAEGKAHTEGLDDEELDHRAEHIGMAAIKYFLLKFSPRKSFEYDPKGSIDFLGQTGPYCLFNYARTRSLLRKAGKDLSFDAEQVGRLGTERELSLLHLLMEFPPTVARAAESLDPSRIAEYLFELCKSFAFIFTDKANHPIVTCGDGDLRQARLMLVAAVSYTLRAGLGLLGINVLEEM